MASAEVVPVIVHAIQLAVAPVFLLTGVAALLGVMANRLARIVDRARHFEEVWQQLDERQRADARVELTKLDRRRHLARWAINFSTSAALLVCLVVTTLFADAFFDTDLKGLAEDGAFKRPLSFPMAARTRHPPHASRSSMGAENG